MGLNAKIRNTSKALDRIMGGMAYVNSWIAQRIALHVATFGKNRPEILENAIVGLRSDLEKLSARAVEVAGNLQTMRCRRGMVRSWKRHANS